MGRWSVEESRQLAAMRNKLAFELKNRRQLPDVVGDRRLLRFLRFHKNVDKASSRFAKFLKWRDDNNVDTIRDEVLSCNSVDDFPHAAKILKLLGNHIVISHEALDNHGNPISFEELSFDPEIVLKTITKEEFMEFFTYYFEYRTLVLEQMSHHKEIKPAGKAKYSGVLLSCTTIRDFRQFTMDKFGTSGKIILKWAVEISNKFYPEMMFRSYMVNMPWYFNSTWYVMKGTMDASSVQKFVVTTTEKLVSEIPLASIPKYIGGEYGGGNVWFPFDLSHEGPFWEDSSPSSILHHSLSILQGMDTARAESTSISDSPTLLPATSTISSPPSPSQSQSQSPSSAPSSEQSEAVESEVPSLEPPPPCAPPPHARAEETEGGDDDEEEEEDDETTKNDDSTSPLPEDENEKMSTAVIVETQTTTDVAIAAAPTQAAIESSANSAAFPFPNRSPMASPERSALAKSPFRKDEAFLKRHNRLSMAKEKLASRRVPLQTIFGPSSTSSSTSSSSSSSSSSHSQLSKVAINVPASEADYIQFFCEANNLVSPRGSDTPRSAAATSSSQPRVNPSVSSAVDSASDPDAYMMWPEMAPSGFKALGDPRAPARARAGARPLSVSRKSDVVVAPIVETGGDEGTAAGGRGGGGGEDAGRSDSVPPLPPLPAEGVPSEEELFAEAFTEADLALDVGAEIEEVDDDDDGGNAVVFVASHQHIAKSEVELSFEAGDIIEISFSDGEWWYGELLRTGDQGWVPPAYGSLQSTAEQGESGAAAVADAREQRNRLDSMSFKLQLNLPTNVLGATMEQGGTGTGTGAGAEARAQLSQEKLQPLTKQIEPEVDSTTQQMARCMDCGEMTLRTTDAIEQHSTICAKRKTTVKFADTTDRVSTAAPGGGIPRGGRSDEGDPASSSGATATVTATAASPVQAPTEGEVVALAQHLASDPVGREDFVLLKEKAKKRSSIFFMDFSKGWAGLWERRRLVLYIGDTKALVYFEGAEPKGYIRMAKCIAREVAPQQANGKYNALVVVDASGVEVLMVCASTRSEALDWISSINAVALGRPLSISRIAFKHDNPLTLQRFSTDDPDQSPRQSMNRRSASLTFAPGDSNAKVAERVRERSRRLSGSFRASNALNVRARAESNASASNAQTNNNRRGENIFSRRMEKLDFDALVLQFGDIKQSTSDNNAEGNGDGDGSASIAEFHGDTTCMDRDRDSMPSRSVSLVSARVRETSTAFKLIPNDCAKFGTLLVRELTERKSLIRFALGAHVVWNKRRVELGKDAVLKVFEENGFDELGALVLEVGATVKEVDPKNVDGKYNVFSVRNGKSGDKLMLGAATRIEAAAWMKAIDAAANRRAFSI